MALDSLHGILFWKMNGLGNDFVILDLRQTDFTMTSQSAQFLGDRTGPYGCDQIISLEDQKGTPFMGIWNADGSAAEACGNAARCVAHLLMEENGKDSVSFLTPSTVTHAARLGDHRISVDMGEPKLHWQQIPLAEQMDDTRFIDIKLGPIDNPVLWGPSAVNVGNPHCVFIVDDIAAHALERFGPLIENHPLFPERTNVSLAQVESKYTIRLKVWERGVGITKACGTAACAALVSTVRRRLTGRKAVVKLDGGELAVEWREEDNHLVMSGPVAMEYSGVIGNE
ncbi:MAG: diaminopimelate epimerase [bacterium]